MNLPFAVRVFEQFVQNFYSHSEYQEGSFPDAAALEMCVSALHPEV
jgi:hypothetical protein